MERCEACIKCDSEYSGGRGTSCHDTCEVFQQWEKERKDDVSRLQKRND